MTSSDPPHRTVVDPAGGGAALAASAPVAAAIFVFGTIYGAGAHELADPLRVIASSALIFSGAAQFTMVSLLGAGAGLGALVATVVLLNLRNVVLGAVMRPRLGGGWLRRALGGLVLIDETVGLAVAAGSRPRAVRVYVTSGLVCYAAWVGGTAAGVATGAATGAQALADAVFPVLFVGLAVVAATTRSLQVRTLAAMGLTAAILWLMPALAGIAPIGAAVAAAAPRSRS